MEPRTDGAPRILQSELPPRVEPGTDGAPRISISELPITHELRGWSLGLMGRPGF